VIEDVEKIGAGLQRKTLAELGHSLQAEIDLRCAESVLGIGAEIALKLGPIRNAELAAV